MNDTIVNTDQTNANINKEGANAYSKLGWAFLVFLASQILLPFAAQSVLLAINPALAQSQLMGMPLIYACMYLVGFPLMLLILKNVPTTPSWPKVAAKKKMGFGEVLSYYPIMYFCMAVINIFAMYLESAMGKSGTITAEDLVMSDTSQWVFFICGVILAPIMEEIIFRKLTYDKGMRYGKGLYLAWTGIAFGLFHLNFGQSLYAGVMGVLFAKIMYETGSVLYTIIIHMLVNFTGGIGIGTIILRSGNETALLIYSYYLTGLLLVGAVLSIAKIIKGVRAKKRTHALEEEFTEPPTPQFTDVKKAFLNPGMILFSVACLAFIVLGFL